MLDSRRVGEVPTIYKACVFGLNFRGYTPKIWPKIWYYRTSVLGCWFLPIEQTSRSSKVPSKPRHLVAPLDLGSRMDHHRVVLGDYEALQTMA